VIVDAMEKIRLGRSSMQLGGDRVAHTEVGLTMATPSRLLCSDGI
jgi:hypothetical protein